MFTKSKETDTSAGVTSARRTPRTNVPSIISGDLIVSGTLISAGEVQVDGRVEGDIRATSVVIGEQASVKGDVYAEEAIIRGRVEGSIRARKVQLCSTSHVEGNILHEALSVEAGAFFEGNCRHSDNPLADAPEKTAPRSAVKPVPVAAVVNSDATPMPAGSSTPIKTEDARPQPARATASFTPIKT
jgi:cytoskeletal protein CcmA (bactofilin family)